MKTQFLACWFAASLPAAAATFTVENVNDSGPGSLRQAIMDANATPGSTVAFSIAGTPPHTIMLNSALPIITNAMLIDGYTQPGASANTLSNGNNAVLLVEVTATNFVGFGFRLNAAGTTVRGLVLNGFLRAFSMTETAGVVIQGNFIGLEPSGLNVSPRGTGTGVYLADTSGSNVIGGLLPAERNVISGAGIGIDLTGNTFQNIVQGNFIGTDRHGTQAVGGSTYGIRVQSRSNVIGGPIAAARNIISGHGVGLLITSDNSRFNVVQGNFIGTDVTGTIAVPNGMAGVSMEGQSNVLGGVALVPGEPPGNLISGNIGSGVAMSGIGHLVQGNLIGTDITGTLRLPNSSDGILANAGRSTIGGTNAGAGNVISGNQFIGLNTGSGAGATNLIAGNWIGTDVTGTLNLSNGLHGIRISGARANTIGPSNVIAFNGGHGIFLHNFAATENFITANSIYGNGQLGIDLANGNVSDGVSPNDACDADSGLPNRWQNYPVLTNVVSTPTTTTIEGYLPSTANEEFRLEFFANDSCGPSGHGEGRTYLGFITVTNAPDCTNHFSATLPVGELGGKIITATATDTNRNTSEFSACLTATGTTSIVPTLTIVPAGTAQAQISWTPNPSGWVLQETWSLAPSNWTNSPSGAANPVTLSATNAARFYRLHKP